MRRTRHPVDDWPILPRVYPSVAKTRDNSSEPALSMRAGARARDLLLHLLAVPRVSYQSYRVLDVAAVKATIQVEAGVSAQSSTARLTAGTLYTGGDRVQHIKTTATRSSGSSSSHHAVRQEYMQVDQK